MVHTLLSRVNPFGAVRVRDPKDGREFTVNGQRLKHVFEPSMARVEVFKLQDLAHNT